jgi:hypothetical protein
MLSVLPMSFVVMSCPIYVQALLVFFFPYGSMCHLLAWGVDYLDPHGWAKCASPLGLSPFVMAVERFFGGPRLVFGTNW